MAMYTDADWKLQKIKIKTKSEIRCVMGLIDDGANLRGKHLGSPMSEADCEIAFARGVKNVKIFTKTPKGSNRMSKLEMKWTTALKYHRKYENMTKSGSCLK